ncbi:probable indole-3-acetic acid-amido synthetase GH3.6 [Macadamia integrifolia]|uniref:probable indole-3-acetic acid-amido synthetase GH3.6 n=1 Tax=Macadamia integrifolia TaxID=60698 RepID=UPI001C4FDEA9|nr:probable indole-3-acetic acid-amido synthetase GH3.6 [Macadamia integrifolia]
MNEKRMMMMEGDKEIMKKLDESTCDAQRLQLQTLQSILQRNARVGYLQPHLHHLQASQNDDHDNDNDPLTLLHPDTFRRLVPLSSYEDYAHLINRIADGLDPSSLLSFDPLLCFFYSSGTSSRGPKLIPYFDSPHSKAASLLAHQGSAAILRRLFPPQPTGDKILWFLYAGTVTETKGGFKAMAASAFPFHHNNSNRPSPILSMCASPKEVILATTDTHHQMYCHLLCALRNPDSITAIRAPYAIGLIRAFRILESMWEQLCEDLQYGSVSPHITHAPMRDAVCTLLGDPQPHLSNRIRVILEARQWSGILPKLWPKARYIACVTTGSMKQYYQKLKFYAGEIPVLGSDYFASECPVGVNLDRTQPPELTRYVILPTAAYYEFLPFGIDTGVAGETVDISGVEIGKEYEVVVTTYRGLFRYRLGDIVRVVGFYNSSPQLEFVMRAPTSTAEDLTERDLMSAMEHFQIMLRDEAKGEVLEFAGYMDLESNPRHTTIFVEFGEEGMSLMKEKSVGVLSRWCSFIEECLGGIYKVQRKRGDLGPLVLSIVKPGSFDGLLLSAVEKGAPANQYKPPKIIRNRWMIDFMEASVVLQATTE